MTRQRLPRVAVVLAACAVVAASCPSSDGTIRGPNGTTTVAPTEPRACPEIVAGAAVSEEQAVAIHAAVFADPTNSEKRAAWKALLPRYGELFVVEGDLLMQEPDLENYLIEVASAKAAFTSGERERTPELFLNIPDDGPACWLPHERNLTFSIDRTSFCPDCADCECAAYTTMVADLAAAARDWEQSCPSCNVGFDHQRAADAAPNNDEVLFVVRQCEMYPTLGLAFFPRDGKHRQFVDVAPEAATSSFTRVGILRHELGHVLGYRHEQLDEDSGCYRKESGQWDRITEYDPRSVMHYPCGKAEGQNARLELSALDRSGHRETYQERCVQ